jgi:hypothetical protein
MIKYTKKYCKENKVAIGCYTGKEVKQLAKMFGDDSNNGGYWFFHYNRKDYLHYYCPYSMTHGSYESYNRQNVSCIFLEQFIKDNTEEIPDFWCVLANEETFTWAKNKINNHIEINYVIHNTDFLCINQTSYPKYECYYFLSKSDKEKEKYTEISFEQFKKHILKLENNMERKIVGYLVKPEFQKAASGVLKNEGYELNLISSGIGEGCNFTQFSGQYNYFLQYKVLDIWFDIIYKEEYKVGDWVTITKIIGEGWLKDVKQKTFKLLETPEEYSQGKFWSVKQGGLHAEFRKATPEEIQNATERYVTLSNGKEVRINKEGVLAEGKTTSITTLQNLLKPNLVSFGGWNIELTDARYRIGCWENIKKYDIENIIKNYNEIC